MIDPVEILNRFTEYNPANGETPLPLPIPGHWFRKICALADRIAAAENENDKLRYRCLWLEKNNQQWAANNPNMYQLKTENETLKSRLSDAREDVDNADEQIAMLKTALIKAEAKTLRIEKLRNALHDIVAETLGHDNSPNTALANIVHVASAALGDQTTIGDE